MQSMSWRYPAPVLMNHKNEPVIDKMLEKKRQYNREKQREFRKKLEMQLEGLRNTVQALEHELITRQEKKIMPRSDQAMSILPWREVATVFSKSAMNAMHTNRALKSELKQLKLVAGYMHHWIHPAEHPAMTPEQTYTNSGRIILYKENDSRKLGAEWITERLRYNADSIFQNNGMHLNDHDQMSEMDVTRNPHGGFQYILRHQRVIPASFERVCDAYQLIGRGEIYDEKGVDLILSGRTELDQELMCSLDKNIVYSQGTYMRNGCIWHDNKIWRTFRFENRLLIVSQNVQCDELHPLTPLQRNRFSLISIDRIDDTSTMTRQLNYNSQAFTKDGNFVSLDIETKQFNVDISNEIDEDKKSDMWISIQKQRGLEFCIGMEKHFNTALEKAMLKLELNELI